MVSSRTTGRTRAAIVVAAATAALALAAGAAAAPAGQARQADSICKLTSSSDWKKLDEQISKAGDAVSAAMSGTAVKEGQAAAKVLADSLRKESKLLAKASGDAKVRKSLSAAYGKVAELYDRVAEKLPEIASSLKAAQKGDTKALNKVMDVVGKVLTPAAEAMGKLTMSWSDLTKAC